MLVWYYAKGGARFGPVDEVEIKRLAETGVIHPLDLVWAEGFDGWVPAKRVKWLLTCIESAKSGSCPPPLPDQPPPIPCKIAAGSGWPSNSPSVGPVLRFRKPWRAYGIFVSSIGWFLANLCFLLSVKLNFMLLLAGSLILGGFLVFLYGLMDAHVFNGSIPSTLVPRLERANWGLILAGFLMVIVPNLRTPSKTGEQAESKNYVDAISRVLAEDADTLSNARTYLEVFEKMNSINLEGCPGDFCQAYLAHYHAWEYMVSFEREARAYDTNFNSVEAFAEAYVRGALGDPFGKMNEAIVEKNRLRENFQYGIDMIRKTHDRVKEIAAKYGVVVR